MIPQICYKFREHIFYGFKIIERTDFHTKNYNVALFRKNIDKTKFLNLCLLLDNALYLYQDPRRYLKGLHSHCFLFVPNFVSKSQTVSQLLSRQGFHTKIYKRGIIP